MSEQGRVSRWFQDNILALVIAGCYVFAWTAATLHLVSMGLPGWAGAALLALMFVVPIVITTLNGGLMYD